MKFVILILIYFSVLAVNLNLFYSRTFVTENSQLNFINDYIISKAIACKWKLKEFVRSDYRDGNCYKNKDSSYTTIRYSKMPVTKTLKSRRLASGLKGLFRSKST